MELTVSYVCGCVETATFILHCNTKDCHFGSYTPEKEKAKLPLPKVSNKDIYFYSHYAAFVEFSNFYRAVINVDGKSWATVEHYYQAMKTHDPVAQEYIRISKHPAEAKKLGKKAVMRHDWEQVKEGVMFKALWAKFTQHDKLKKLLLGTGKVALHEDSPYDKYWGVKGKDRLGIILGRVRNELHKV